MNEKTSITKMDGVAVTADIIALIKNNTNGKEYVYYTLNEIVGAEPSSTVKIYVSKVKQDDINLDAPITEEDWKFLKDIMSDSIKGNKTANIEYLPCGDSLVSISDRAIAMPTSYDYVNKQRKLYMDSVGNAGTGSADVITPSEQPVVPVMTSEAAVQPTPEPVPVAKAVTSEPTPAVQTAVEDLNVPATPTPAPAVDSLAPTSESPVAAPGVSIEPSVVTPEAAVIPASEVQAPVEPVIPSEPTVEPSPVTPKTVESEPQINTAANLTPIDIQAIEAKYTQMIADINALRDKEIEAAKRYNATLELNSMHTEQHTNFVQNDIKANASVEPIPIVPTPEPSPVPIEQIAPTPTPAPVTPTDIETNWFDMPNNN